MRTWRDATNSDGCVILNFAERQVAYAGMLCWWNEKKPCSLCKTTCYLPWCITNALCGQRRNRRRCNLFFCLSGTGKTTLSADPETFFNGDDEHGWVKTRFSILRAGVTQKPRSFSEEWAIIWIAIKFGTNCWNVVCGSFETRVLITRYVFDPPKWSRALPSWTFEKLLRGNRSGVSQMHLSFLNVDLTGVLSSCSILTKESGRRITFGWVIRRVGSKQNGRHRLLSLLSRPAFGAPSSLALPIVVMRISLIQAYVEEFVVVYVSKYSWTGGAHGQGG